jgi:hypothetical protein
MSVAVYKLRIRERPGDDSDWHEARVVAATLAEALVQAQQRFGDDRVLAIEQDATAVADDEIEEEATVGPDAAAAMAELLSAAPIVSAAPARIDAVAHVASAPSTGAAPGLAYATPHGADYAASSSGPFPWEGRWRPSVLLWIGAIAGLVAFALWYQFGASGRERFVTAAPAESAPATGLPIEGSAPPGGVLAATGLPIQPGLPEARLGASVGDPLQRWPEAQAAMEDITDEDDEVDPRTVRTIGTLVGDMFSRWPTDDPSKRVSDDAPASWPPQDDGYAPPRAALPEPMPRMPPPPPPPPVRGSELRPYYVEVRRSGNVTETLRVTAYDADHARAIVMDLPERPRILRGPSAELDW